MILIRERVPGGEAEVFLVRRHRGSSFMAHSFVFPGGAVDRADRGLREAAARELFEEAGVLLAETPLRAPMLATARRSLHAGRSFERVLQEVGAHLAPDRLHYFAHWVTPSLEPKRFDVTFFIAELPHGQSPSFDNIETVDEAWVTPAEALESAGPLRLPPPQLRTMYELREAATSGPAAVIALAADRARHPHPVLPRAVRMGDAPGGFAVLLPWDPDYAQAPGEGIPIPVDHPLAVGPSRMLLSSDGWHLVDPTEI